MKTQSLSRFLTLAATATVLLSGNAKATLIAHASFNDIAAGDINGKAGGTGFTGNWTGVAGQSVVSGGLSYSNGSININGGSQSVLLTQSSDNHFFRSLPASQNADVIYMSFLIRQDTGLLASGDSDTVLFWADNVSNTNHTAGVPNLGLNGSNGSLLARLNGHSSAQSGNLVQGVTALLVARFEKTTPGTGNNFTQAALWVNPSSLAASPTITGAIGTGALSSFSIAGIRTNSINQNPTADTVYVDELRIGTTFASVIPEPSAAVLGIFAFVGWSARRRRNG